MDEETQVVKSPLEECAAQLGSAAQAMERVIGKLEAQYEALNQKIDRIIATVEKSAAEEKAQPEEIAVAARAGDAERELMQRAARKTLAPAVSTLLAKSGVGEGVQVDAGVLEKALAGLRIEQRIAVKAELARAGMIA